MCGVRLCVVKESGAQCDTISYRHIASICCGTAATATAPEATLAAGVAVAVAGSGIELEKQGFQTS